MDKKLEIIIEDYLSIELKLSNFEPIECTYKTTNDSAFYEVVIEDNTTKERSIVSIDNLHLLAFIYNSTQKRFFN